MTRVGSQRHSKKKKCVDMELLLGTLNPEDGCYLWSLPPV